MKKLSLILFALAMTGCGVVFACSGLPESRIAVVKKGETFKVIYSGPETTVKLSILDSDGKEVFSEKVISHGGFIRPYDLSQLPKGDYKICVRDGLGAYFQDLCTKDPELLVHVTKLPGPDRRLMVTIPHQGSEFIEIQIYDQTEQLVYHELESTDADFAKIYNLKNLAGGTIRMINQKSGDAMAFGTE